MKPAGATSTEPGEQEHQEPGARLTGDVTDQVPAPPELLGRLRPIPTYRDHPATTGCDIEGVDPAGARRSVGIVASGEPVFLLFLSSSCQGCRDLWEGVDELRHALGPRVRVVVVTRGPEQEDAAMVARLAAARRGWRVRTGRVGSVRVG